jgi:glucose-6-phosphate isomerase
MGKNIYKLRSEIRLFLKGKLALILKDSSIKLASILKKNFIHDLILVSYIPEIEKFLYWCQQLIAESLGKKNKGFLPVVSTAPKDHHSLLQLYLDGPKNKLFYIFSLENKLKNNQKIQKKNNQKKLLNNKNLLNIKTAQKEALIKVFKQKKISFREFKIKEFNEEVLGQLFSYFILETIIIGQLVNINPYNQPAVEQVKTITKKILN